MNRLGEAPKAKDKLKILLVEDHPGTLKIMTRLLRQFGHMVTPVSTVKDAIDTAEHQEFNLLVSDLGLPDGTGTM